MSVQRGFGLNGKSIYMNICKPEIVMCNFVIDSTNGNGLGIRSLKSNGYIENVFMHTSATPGSNNGFLNPNPASGYALIQLKSNFNVYLGGFSGFVSPVTGSNLTSTTAGLAYVIVSLGTTSLAQWQAAGVPPGFVPAVGMSFIAKATGAIGGTGAVKVPGVSGISSLEVIGDPNMSISNSNISQNAGAQILVQMLAATSSSVTTPIASAPANGSVCGMSFWFDASSVSIDGL